MKIREFFSVPGFDPERCQVGRFWNFADEDGNPLEKPCPVCPIAQASELRGYKGAKSEDDMAIIAPISEHFDINSDVLTAFVRKFDSTSDFDRALNYAEEFESIEGRG